MRKPLETSVEDFLVEQIEALGGIALKGDIKGRRFLDRILILPNGITIYCEVKRPIGGRFSKHQGETLKRLDEMGHYTWKVREKKEVLLFANHIKRGYVGVELWTFLFFSSQRCSSSTSSSRPSRSAHEK